MDGSVPRIGLVSYGKGKDPKWYRLPVLYVEAIRRSGGFPLIFPPGETDLSSYIEPVDGFILAGGGDIEPRTFGQEPHPALSGQDPERDATELGLARALIARRMPQLAICRGLQVLNVALGGDLIQHLDQEAKGRVGHRLDGAKAAMHRVKVAAGSQLAMICGAAFLEVASNHHQAARRLGKDLRPVAWTEDGVVEALELEAHPEVLAVQWHPEETAAEDTQQQALFDWLVRRAAGS